MGKKKRRWTAGSQITLSHEAIAVWQDSCAIHTAYWETNKNWGQITATINYRWINNVSSKFNNVSGSCQPCLTFRHRSFTFNSNKSPTWCNNFSVYYHDVCLQQHVSGLFSRPSSCVRGRAGRPARPRTQHDCHHDTKVKPEAATAVIEFLIMGGKTPETCWAVNKRKLKNCCIRLVIYLNCTIMHGLIKLKFYI
jgi:hypothetical protein